MSSASVIKVSDFDASNLSFGQIKVNAKTKSKSVPLLYNRAPLQLSIPTMLTTYGISKYVDKDTGKFSYSLTLSFDDTPNSIEFRNKIEELEDTVVSKIMDISSAFMGKEYKKKETLKEKFVSSIKFGKNDTKKEGQASFRGKVSHFISEKDGSTSYGIKIYDFNRELLFPSKNFEHPDDVVKPKTMVKCVFDGSSIWASPQGVGISWRLTQIAVGPSKVLPLDSCLVEFESSEFDDE